MIPLVDIPEIIKHYAPLYKDLFTTAGYENFQRYLSGLLISDNKTVEAINRLFVVDVKKLWAPARICCKKSVWRPLPYSVVKQSF